MHKLNSVHILIQVPALAKRSLTILLFVSVTGCGSGHSTSTGDTTPTNPQPAQASVYADQSVPNALTELGGAVLPPGIYSSAHSMDLSTGDLILDAQGNTNAVWIFEIATDLRVATGRRVILSAGAQAANVYWQVGGSATLGEYSVFKGKIIANGAVTLLAGADWEGQASPEQARVNLAANTSASPSP